MIKACKRRNLAALKQAMFVKTLFEVLLRQATPFKAHFYANSKQEILIKILFKHA